MVACRLLSTSLLLAAVLAGTALGALPPPLPVAPLLAEAPRRCRGPAPSEPPLPILTMAALWGNAPATNRTVTLVTQLSVDR